MGADVLITRTEDLATFCNRASKCAYVTVDTEFIRETTYWPQLCLVQLAISPEDAVAVDPLAEGIDLAPLDALMLNKNVLKVFHAGRQDLEIFFKRMNALPTPIFDTQVAAMVCGFGESASYEKLVNQLIGAHLDKGSRYTDWAVRPLSARQLTYAIGDVTHLCCVYEKLAEEISSAERMEWVAEEMAILTNPATYNPDVRETWRRLKPRTESRRFLAILRELAAWREMEAQKRNLPRGRVLRDDILMELAAHAPKNANEMSRLRGISQGFSDGKLGQGALEAIKTGTDLPEKDCPPHLGLKHPPKYNESILELLRVLLRMASEEHKVAAKLIAGSDDLICMAAGENEGIPALSGWRREVFGENAIALMEGKACLGLKRGHISLIRE
ncbi:MAG TPA: ribonuclease D [Rhodospirillaceae bacterium]|nr:MAG: ribonuclease D [Alphaproteobacteria bacterium GWF2_58_20]HAU28855.1 ribonuclease D [Rhodospirillaceae bacterium]